MFLLATPAGPGNQTNEVADLHPCLDKKAIVKELQQ
jgi:hypothetical protein